MANIKFGFNQMGKITPDQARWIPRVYAAFAAFITGWTTSANLLSPHAQTTLTQFFIYFAPFVIAVENMFGVVPAQGDSVNITSAAVEPKK